MHRAAGLLEKADITLSDAVTELLVRQKQISVGKSYSEASLITEPMPHGEIVGKIRALGGDDVRDHVLTQEIFRYNPDLYFEDYIYLDVLIGHAVRLGWLDQQPERSQTYEQDKAAAWQSFYQLPPAQCATYIAMALQFLTVLGEAEETSETDPIDQVA